MKGIYRGCNINVTREDSTTGQMMIFFNVYHNDYEVTSGYSEGGETVREFYNDLKEDVDEYLDELNKEE